MLSPEANNPTQQNLPKALAQSVDVPLHNHHALHGKFNMDSPPGSFPPEKLVTRTKLEDQNTKSRCFYTNRHSLQVAYRKRPFKYHQFRSSLSESGKNWCNLGGKFPSQTPPTSPCTPLYTPRSPSVMRQVPLQCQANRTNKGP